MKFFDKRQEGKMQVNVEEKGAYKLKFSQKLYFFLKLFYSILEKDFNMKRLMFCVNQDILKIPVF